MTDVVLRAIREIAFGTILKARFTTDVARALSILAHSAFDSSLKVRMDCELRAYRHPDFPWQHTARCCPGQDEMSSQQDPG